MVALLLPFLACSDVSARTVRHVFVAAGAAEGDGSREKPYGGIQEAIDRHDKDWGVVNIGPGIYKEDVVIRRDSLWFRPALQYGVVIDGSFTIAGSGIYLRGLTFQGGANAIVVSAGAKNCYLLDNRVVRMNDGGVGIRIESPVTAFGNVVDLRRAEAKGTTGIRLLVPADNSPFRLDHNQVAGAQYGIVAEAAQPPTDTEAAATHLSNNTVLECGVGVTIRIPRAIVKYNRIFASKTIGLAVSGRACRIEANTIRGSEAEGLRVAGCGIRVLNNVVYGGKTAAAVLAPGAVDVAVCSNTLHDNGPGGKAPFALPAETAGTIAANVFSGNEGFSQVQGDWQIVGNLFTHKDGHTRGRDGLLGDPRFVEPEAGDFHLSPDSPAIAAATMPEEVRHDRDGLGRPASKPSEIGAFVFPRPVKTPRVFCVAPGAAKDGDGSAERPLGSITEAMSRVGPGDTVLLADGNHRENVTVAVSGTPVAPITLRSRSQHGARLVQCRITLDDCTNVRLEGLTFEGCIGSVTFGPHARYNVVTGCRFVTAEGKSNSTINVIGPDASHNVIEDCRFEGTGHHLVAIQLICQWYNHHVVMRRNTISGYDYGVQTGAGSGPTAPPGYHVVEDCEFFDNTEGVHAKMSDGIIRNNHLHHNRHYGITIRGGARHLIEGNRIHHNDAAIRPPGFLHVPHGGGIRLHSSSHVVRNNVIYANDGVGILLTVFMGEPAYEPPTANFMVNNTFWRNRRPAIRIEQGTRCSILRNILVGSSPDDWLVLREDSQSKSPGEMSGAIRLADFNIYHNGRLPLLREYEGGEHNRETDPLLAAPEKGDFRLAAGSPAREAIPTDWIDLPPIPFGINADPKQRTIGASMEVARPDRTYGNEDGRSVPTE